jgi:O-methyltransferase
LDKFFFIRKAKGWFFRFRLHTFVPSKTLTFLSYSARLSRWIKEHSFLEFSDYYSSKIDLDKRYSLYQQIIEKEKLSNIDYLEFGVAGGESIRWWLKNISDKNARFFGFDTFTGLPEDWGLFKKGEMNNNNELPVVDDGRCTFFQGLFQQTLPDFLKNYEDGKRKVIHMDADLYSSTLYTLTSLSPVLRKGDIVFFDEFNVPLHEFKAFTEWTESFYIRYEVLGSVNNFYQVAFKLQ